MLITIKSKRLLRLTGWKRSTPSYVRAEHKLWWRWLISGEGQILSSDVAWTIGLLKGLLVIFIGVKLWT